MPIPRSLPLADDIRPPVALDGSATPLRSARKPGRRRDGKES